MKSLMSRNLSLTSYFSPIFDYTFDNCFDWSPPSMALLTPYVIKWSDIAIHVMHKKVTIFYTKL